MELKTDRQIVNIVANIKKVIKTGNISVLNKQSYNFLYLSSGFIAHYNIHGFKDYYSDTEELKTDILNNKYYNRYQNFFPNDKDYEYYKQKAFIYNLICINIGGK